MDDAPRCGPEEQPAFAASLICVPENHIPLQISEEMESEVSVTVPQPSMILSTGFPPIVGYPIMDVFQSKEVNMSEEVCRNDRPTALDAMQQDHPLISPIPITGLLEDTPIPAEPDHPQIPSIPLTALLENTPPPAQPDTPSHDIKPQAPVTKVSAGQVPAGLTVAPPEEVPETLSQMTTIGEAVSQPEIVPEVTAPIPATTVPEPSTASGSPRAPAAPETPVGPKKPLRRKPKDPNAMFVSRNTVAKRKVNLGGGRKIEYEKEAKSSPLTANPPPRTARDELPPLPATPQPSKNRPRPRPHEDEDDPDRARKTPATTIAVVVLSPPQQDPAEIAQRRLFAPRKSRFTAQQVTGAHAAELADRERLDAALASRRAVEAEREEAKKEVD